MAADPAIPPEGGEEPFTMALSEKIIITVVYLISMFILAIFPKTLGLGRPLIALIGAAVVVFIQGLTAGPQLNWEEDIDFDVIYFLFGLMIISHYMELTGFSRVPRSMIDFGARKTANSGPYMLLWIICMVTAVIAMIFTNDMAVYLLTPEIVRMSKTYPNLAGATHIFLIAVATSANIGAAVSPIGSPQNALIHSIGEGVEFVHFWKYLSLPTAAVLVLNCACLHVWMFFNERKRKANNAKLTEPLLSGSVNEESQFTEQVAEEITEGKPFLAKAMLPADALHRLSTNRRYSVKGEDGDWGIIQDDQDATKSAQELEQINEVRQKKEVAVMNILSVISGLVFVAWVTVVSVTRVFLGWTTLLASLTIMICHALAVYWYGEAGSWSPDRDIFRSGHIIDYGLLFLFQGMFILVGSLLHTGWPEQIFDYLLGQTGDAIIELWLVLILLYSILAASNILSNVPVIMLLKPLIDKVADPLLGWMIVAWASTIAGNLTLVGSAANLIVAERSKQIGGPDLTFFGHFPYGFSSTMVFALVGLLLLYLVY